MTDGESTPIFERGDVVYGADPFKDDEAARPWLDGLIDVPDASWLCGGTPGKSRIVPWGVQSINHADVDF